MKSLYNCICYYSFHNFLEWGSYSRFRFLNALWKQKRIVLFPLTLATLVRMLGYLLFQEEKERTQGAFQRSCPEEGFSEGRASCPCTRNSVMDGSELSPRRAGRPSTFCSLHKQQEQGREDRILYLAVYRSLTLAMGGKWSSPKTQTLKAIENKMFQLWFFYFIFFF